MWKDEVRQSHRNGLGATAKAHCRKRYLDKREPRRRKIPAPLAEVVRINYQSDVSPRPQPRP
jgi:hypothetical protein